MSNTSGRTPKPGAKLALVEPSEDAERSWWRSHPFTVGGAVAVALFGGGLWWRRRRRRRIQLKPVSEQWLQQHEYASGQREQE
jgi:hypothetical protein